MKKYLLVLILALSLLCLFSAMAVAAEYGDMPDNWSTEALTAAVDNGLLGGIDGKLLPDKNLTRAEMAAIINRAFGSKQQADISKYADVAKGSWYYYDMGKAVYMKTFKGDGNKLNPKNNITRQEAFVVLARAFNLSGGKQGVLNHYTDGAKVAAWAKDGVSSLLASGYIKGDGKSLKPDQCITRAEFAQVMHNIVKTYIKDTKPVTSVNDGNVMISVADATLQGVTIKGDLIIGDGVGEGDITLDSVTVTGRTVIRGGGVDSIKVIGNSKLDEVFICKVNGNIRIYGKDGAEIKGITIEQVDDGKDGVIIEGNVGKLTVAAEVQVTLQNATIAEVVVSSQAEVTVSKESTVTLIKIEANSAKINGEGTVKNAEITGNNVKIDTAGTDIKIGEGVEGTTTFGNPVAETTTPPVIGGGGGGGGDTAAVPQKFALKLNGSWVEYNFNASNPSVVTLDLTDKSGTDVLTAGKIITDKAVVANFGFASFNANQEYSVKQFITAIKGTAANNTQLTVAQISNLLKGATPAEVQSLYTSITAHDWPASVEISTSGGVVTVTISGKVIGSTNVTYVLKVNENY